MCSLADICISYSVDCQWCKLFLLCAVTSTQAVVNLPLALAVVLVIRFLSQRIVVDTRSGAMSSRSSRRMDRYMFPPVYYREKFGGPGGEGGGGHNDREAWKKIMSAPIVASAWESLCGSILQEVRLNNCDWLTMYSLAFLLLILKPTLMACHIYLRKISDGALIWLLEQLAMWKALPYLN